MTGAGKDGHWPKDRMHRFWIAFTLLPMARTCSAAARMRALVPLPVQSRTLELPRLTHTTSGVGTRDAQYLKHREQQKERKGPH